MKKLQGILMLLLSSVLLVSCQANKNENKDQNNDPTKKYQTHKPAYTKKKDKKKKEQANNQNSDSSNKSSSSTNIKTEDTQVIGSDEYGYVKVPKKWVHFKDINGGNDIQYSDVSTYNIITLNIYRPSQLGISEAEYASIHPVQVANSVLTSQKNSSTFKEVWGAQSKIGGYDAYVVNSITTTGKYFVTYVFKADDGKIHYTSIEGDKDTVTKMIPLIEESWSLKK